VKEAPHVAKRVKEDVVLLRELRALKAQKKGAAPSSPSSLDAAAEE
jgi:hypothetical protein